MPAPSKPLPSAQAEGIIQLVDSVNRELRVLVAGAAAPFDVPANCPTLLHGERVKFRLLQPGDYVRLTFVNRRGRSVARKIEVWIKHTS